MPRTPDLADGVLAPQSVEKALQQAREEGAHLLLAWCVEAEKNNRAATATTVATLRPFVDLLFAYAKR